MGIHMKGGVESRKWRQMKCKAVSLTKKRVNNVKAIIVLQRKRERNNEIMSGDGVLLIRCCSGVRVSHEIFFW